MLASDSAIRNAVSRFFEDAEAAVCRTPEDVTSAMKNLFNRDKPSRLVDGVMFNVDADLDQCAQNIIRQIAKRLGAKAGDETALSNLLWKYAVRKISEFLEPAKAAKDFLDFIEDESRTERRYIEANTLAVREDGVNRLIVGPVSIVSGSLITQEMNEGRSAENWIAEVRDGEGPQVEDGRYIVAVAPNVWSINVVAARENLTEEAAWLAAVAVSLLRVTMKFSLGPFLLEFGQVEPHPFVKPFYSSSTITTSKDGVSTGGKIMQARYVLTKETAKLCETPEFKKIATDIFDAKKGTVGERLSQGLGWLTRGRQSHDRAERLLFFFTAIEALLSSSDKSAPVVQNIARHASSILSDEHAAREKNAKIVRDLYAFRSAVVHGGARGVAKREANTIEYIADQLFFRVLDQVDLTESFSKFQADLSTASYGAAWGSANSHRLGAISFEPEVENIEAKILGYSKDNDTNNQQEKTIE